MMSGIRGRNTRPEKLVRSALFAAGFRFRLHHRDIPGRPDLVLAKWRTTVFLNGCFWHATPDCRIFRIPKSRRYFWLKKPEAQARKSDRQGNGVSSRVDY